MSDFYLAAKDKRLKTCDNSWFNYRLSPTDDWIFNIFGPQNTFSIARVENDWICSLGYSCSLNLGSMDDTLKKILLEFDENKILSIKKELVGQYILIIKKREFMYILADFLGCRNIFYSADRIITSSSFSFIEKSLGPHPHDFDSQAFIEFLAVKEILYPCWLGRHTINRSINYLLPYEYIKVNLNNPNFDIKAIKQYINNEKISDIKTLSERLINSLERIIYREEFKDSLLCSSITGGRDSRLVATIAAKKYPNCNYRIAISSINRNSIKDYKVAKKISRINNAPLDVYELKLPFHENIFTKITENFCPAFNITITPIIINADRYAIGFGGVYGTELFAPITCKDIQEYFTNALSRAKSSLMIKENFWHSFASSILDQINEIKEHYHFEVYDERDYIRLFNLLMTARYSSFIIAAFNQFGYQLEPFGSFPTVELAFQISPNLWGNKRRIIGDALVEKAALAKLSPRAGRLLAYSSYRPVMPFSIWLSPIYLWGYALNVFSSASNKIVPRQRKQRREIMPGVFYLSTGWEKYYIEKLRVYDSRQTYKTQKTGVY